MRQGTEQGCQILHTSSNAHRDIKNIVDHERGSSHQARKCAQVFFRHDVRTATIRISRNGLAVGDCHNAQQADDHKANG